MRFFLCLFYMFHRRYSNCRPLNSARYNRIICQRVENTSFFERLSCILHALAKGYQGYKSNFGFHVPFEREIWQIQDQKSVFGFAERNTPCESAQWETHIETELNSLTVRQPQGHRDRNVTNPPLHLKCTDSSSSYGHFYLLVSPFTNVAGYSNGKKWF